MAYATIGNYVTAGTGASTAIKKNSGLLRYLFGVAGAPANTSLPGDPTFGIAAVVNCLGDDLDTMADNDGHLFGNSVGHPAITGIRSGTHPGSIFEGSNLVARNMQAIGAGAGVRFPPNAPGSGTATGQTRSGANGRIPSGSKVAAWFQLAHAVQGTSAVADEQAIVVVQTEVVQNAPYIAGVLQTGPEFITSLRVSVANIGATTSTARGILYVMIENSFCDIPGNTTNNPAVVGGSETGNQSVYPVLT